VPNFETKVLESAYTRVRLKDICVWSIKPWTLGETIRVVWCQWHAEGNGDLQQRPGAWYINSLSRPNSVNIESFVR